MANLIKRYFVVNTAKNEAESEAKELNGEIKDLMAKAEITSYEVDNLKAVVTAKTSRRMNAEAVMKWASEQGLRIPESCFETGATVALTVKPMTTKAA